MILLISESIIYEVLAKGQYDIVKFWSKKYFKCLMMGKVRYLLHYGGTFVYVRNILIFGWQGFCDYHMGLWVLLLSQTWY